MSGKKHQIRLRWRKNDHTHNMLVATQRYVLANGGSLLVLGGLEIQDFHDGPGKFKVAVRCLGRRPVFPESK